MGETLPLSGGLSQVVPNFRVRTVPVLGTTPAIFGMAAASWVLCQLAQKPYIPDPIFRVKVNFPLVQTIAEP